jgi:hypothetical protein
LAKIIFQPQKIEKKKEKKKKKSSWDWDMHRGERGHGEPKLQARVYHGCPITHNDKFQAYNNSNVAGIEKSSCFGVKSESYSILVGYSYKGVGAKPAHARNWAEERNSKEAAIEYY